MEREESAAGIADLFAPYSPSDPRQRALDEDVSRRLSEFLASELPQEIPPTERLADGFGSAAIPESPVPPEEYVRYLFERVVPNSVRTHQRRFVGHMTSALPSFTAPLERIMGALNQNVVKLETSNAFTFYERQALAMIHRLVYGAPQDFYDAHTQDRDSTLGMIVSGGTLANLAALWCARNRTLGPREGFSGIDAEGLPAALEAHGYRRAVIVGSSLMHYSLRKAADLLGIGTRGILTLPAGVDGALDPAALRDILTRCRSERTCVMAVVAIAGTTETGGIDRLNEIANLAQEYGAHLHVDAAWGGPALFSRKYRHRLAGIERADSVAIDGHKQLYTPMGLGMVVLKDPKAARAIEKVANYIVRVDSPDLGRRTLEGSRPAMAIFLHGALHVIGRAGYEKLIDEGIEKCAFMAETINARAEFELLNSPLLNILVYRYVPASLRAAVAPGGALSEADNESINEVNRRLQERQRRTGRSFVSRTVLQNTRHGERFAVVALRSVLANPVTTRDDLLEVLAEQSELGREISSDLGLG